MEKVTDKGFWMDGYLKTNLNTLCYNLNHDWDSVIIISGSGMVRMGKSVLAQQVGYYVAQKMGTPFGVDNINFSGDELMGVAKRLPKNSVIVYDEARGELDTKKVMSDITKTLLDFFAECGMYNHLFILVLPDFFELPKGIATSRSDILLNVFRTSTQAKDKDGEEVTKFERGYFEFFNRDRKKKLYSEGRKRFGDYQAAKYNFFGEFRNYWVVDREAYEAKKISFLSRDRAPTRDKYSARFGFALRQLNKHMTQEEIAESFTRFGFRMTQERVGQLIRGAKGD